MFCIKWSEVCKTCWQETNVSVEPGWPLFYRERVSWTWVATVLPRMCQLNLGGHCSTENVSVEPGWPLFYRERLSWTWVATVLPRTCQLNLGGHCSIENVSVEPGWPLFYRERVSWTWVATVLPRTCQLNLGGHCSTENAVSMANRWHFLNSAQSPGRRRRRRWHSSSRVARDFPPANSYSLHWDNP